MKNISIFCGNITRCGGTESGFILPANEWAKQPGVKLVFYSLTEPKCKTYSDLGSRVRNFRIFHRNIPFPRILLPTKRFAPAIVILTGNNRLQYLETPSKAHSVQITNEVPSPMKNACNDTCREIPDAPFLLSIRRLDYRKGFERLPALAARILKRQPEWKWRLPGMEISGKGFSWKRQPVHSTFRARFIFRGECRNLALWYRYADARSFTSHDKGWGNVIMRTMRQEHPVIAFGGRYGPVEMITSYRNGILAEQGNELCYIHETAAYLDRLPESRTRYPVGTIHAEYFYSGKSLSQRGSNYRRKKTGTTRISELRRISQPREILRSLYSKRILQYSTTVFRSLGIPCTYFIMRFSGGEKLTGMLPQTLRSITCKT